MKDFEGWQNGLKGKKNIRFVSCPKLNHLFIEGEGKSCPAEYEKSGNIPFYIIETIAAWIKTGNGDTFRAYK